MPVDGDTDPEPEIPPAPSIQSTDNGNCLNVNRDVIDGDAPLYPEGFTATYNDQTGLVTATHENVVFFCGMETVNVEMTIDAQTIKLLETEGAGTPADCECPYNAVTIIANLLPETYTIEFYKGSLGNLAGSTTVQVTAK